MDQKTAQEVDQLDIRCPKGCGAIMKIGQMTPAEKSRQMPPQHRCGQDKQPCPECGDCLALTEGELGRHRLICLNVSVACPYAGLGCKERPKKKDMKEHMELRVVDHVQMLHEKLNKIQQVSTVCTVPLNCGRSDNSLQDLYERVVSLEQSLCHQEIQRRSAQSGNFDEFYNRFMLK